MKKIVSMIALTAVLFSMNGYAQEQKPKNKEKKECSAADKKSCKKDKKSCSTAETKSCSTDKKAGCCAKKA